MNGDIGQAIRLIAERKIDEAVREGQFDNLPGHGKPMEIDADWMIPPEWRAALRILKNAGAVPDWVQHQREIDAARAMAEQIWNDCQKGRIKSVADARWEYHKAIKRINDLILAFNHHSPPGAYVQIPVKVSEKLQAFDARFGK